MARTPIARDAPTPPSGAVALPVFDPTRATIISAWGRKGSGKSTASRYLYWSYPFDKLCIDVNGDADPGDDAEPVRRLSTTWPTAPTTVERPRHRNLYYRADPGSDTYDDDLDRAVGMALFPQEHRTLVWCGETSEFTPTAQKTRPAMRRLLTQNRHYNVSALFDGPRPVNVDPRILAQSDYVFVFDLPNPADRQRIADTIGFSPRAFDDECNEVFRRGPFWFLLWDATHHQLLRCPPLPPMPRPERHQRSR